MGDGPGRRRCAPRVCAVRFDLQSRRRTGPTSLLRSWRSPPCAVLFCKPLRGPLERYPEAPFLGGRCNWAGPSHLESNLARSVFARDPRPKHTCHCEVTAQLEVLTCIKHPPPGAIPTAHGPCTRAPTGRAATGTATREVRSYKAPYIHANRLDTRKGHALPASPRRCCCSPPPRQSSPHMPNPLRNRLVEPTSTASSRAPSSSPLSKAPFFCMIAKTITTTRA